MPRLLPLIFRKGRVMKALSLAAGEHAKSLFSLSNVTFTRGHKFKLERPFVNHVKTQNFFTYRIIDRWNALPSYVIEATSVNNFKNRLDSYVDEQNQWKYNFFE